MGPGLAMASPPAPVARVVTDKASATPRIRRVATRASSSPTAGRRVRLGASPSPASTIASSHASRRVRPAAASLLDDPIEARPPNEPSANLLNEDLAPVAPAQRTFTTYDIAALWPIVTEAGGRFSSVDGEQSLATGSALATNGLLHDQVMELVAKR